MTTALDLQTLPASRRPRQHLVTDFLISGHAQIQADRLAAMDREYLRRWFPKLATLAPDP